MKIRAFLLAGLVMSLVGAGTASAKITLSADFEGTLMITTPEGKVVMLDAGNPIPPIESGSTVEVFQGVMTVELSEGDACSLGCLGKTGTVAGPATVKAQCGEKTGEVKAVKGEVIFEDGKVAEGETKSLALGEAKQAAVTAAGEEIGTGTDLGVPPVDSRSIETSPNQ
jgi:hypothetical protein